VQDQDDRQQEEQVLEAAAPIGPPAAVVQVGRFFAHTSLQIRCQDRTFQHLEQGCRCPEESSIRGEPRLSPSERPVSWLAVRACGDPWGCPGPKYANASGSRRRMASLCRFAPSEDLFICAKDLFVAAMVEAALFAQTV